MNSARRDRVFVITLVVLAVYQLFIFVATGANATGVAGPDNGDGIWIFVITSLFGAALIIAGLRLRTSMPLPAGIMIAVGVVPSILMFWMVIPPIIAIAVAIYAIWNGVTGAREPQASF